MLYRLVQQQAETFFAETEAATGVDLPQIVKDEFDTFLACGILAQRFLSAPRPADAGRPWGVSKVAKPHSLERLRCEDCGHDKLVAFSCKRCGLAKPPHRMPNIAGSTAVSVNNAATAASTALPPAASISAPTAGASGCLVTTMPQLREKLWHNVNRLQNGLREKGFDIGNTNTPVTPIYMKGDVPEATQMVMDLRENYHVFCSIVVYPVIPKGDIIYRLIPTAVHSDEDIDITLKAFEATKKKLDTGEYKASDIPNMADATV